jgi:hypothetical protein
MTETTTVPEQVCISETEFERRMEERRAAGKLIDPATARVWWQHAMLMDPYGDGLEIGEEYRCIGRVWFARAPDSDCAVWVADLPDATRDAIWKRLDEAA